MDHEPLCRQQGLLFQLVLQPAPGRHFQFLLLGEPLGLVDGLAIDIVLEGRNAPIARALRGFLDPVHRLDVAVEQVVPLQSFECGGDIALALRNPVQMGVVVLAIVQDRLAGLAQSLF